MNKFLIAAGVGALLIVAQTAVSAAYSPLDRSSPPVTDGAAPVTTAISPRGAALAPVDMAATNSVFGSDEITAPPSRREIPVTDRVSGATGRYNLALNAVSQQQTCTKTIGFKGKTIPTSSEFSYKCAEKTSGYPAGTPLFIGGIALASAIVLLDGGDSD